MAEDTIHEVDGSTWELMVEKNPDIVFVMYYSPECKHCTQMMPYVEQISSEYIDGISFLRINTLLNSWIAERYGVLATPTFQIFCGGKPVVSKVGAIFPAMLKKMIEEMIEHGKECSRRSTELKYEITGYG